jgi:hypothetical protein
VEFFLKHNILVLWFETKKIIISEAYLKVLLTWVELADLQM